MTTLGNIVSRASSQLNDIENIRWTKPELLDWINEGIKQIVIFLPESNAVSVEHQLDEGTKQSIPADGVRLIDVIRNTGLEGGKPSGPIRIIERDVLDALRPNWHRDRSATSVKNFVFDSRNPKTFYVYPPARGQFVEVVYSKMPEPLLTGDELGRFEVYSAAILNYVLHRAYSKDTEESSSTRSQRYEQSFFNAIGLFDQADMKAQPNHYAPPRNKTTGEAY